VRNSFTWFGLGQVFPSKLVVVIIIALMSLPSKFYDFDYPYLWRTSLPILMLATKVVAVGSC